MKKKTILFFFIFFLLFLFAGFPNNSTFSQGLEIDYPTIDEYHPTSVNPGGFPEYLRYIIRFLTIGAGVVAFGALAYGGFLWMTSEGEPLKLQKSRTRIFSAFIGLLIVVSSYLLLNTISPTLIELEKIEIVEVEDPTSPGVYLSLSGSFHDNDEEKIKENVRRIRNSERGLGSLQGKIKAVRIVNPVEDGEMVYRYVVVLHSEENFEGKCKTLVSNQSSPKDFNLRDIGEEISSINIIGAEKFDTAYGQVTAYDKPEFREGSNMQTLSVSPSGDLLPLDIEVWSIDIEGNYAIVLASGSGWSEMNDGCAVFASSRPITSLVGHRMNRCRPYFFSKFFAAYRSCATHYSVFPLYKR